MAPAASRATPPTETRTDMPLNIVPGTDFNPGDHTNLTVTLADSPRSVSPVIGETIRVMGEMAWLTGKELGACSYAPSALRSVLPPSTPVYAWDAPDDEDAGWARDTFMAWRTQGLWFVAVTGQSNNDDEIDDYFADLDWFAKAAHIDTALCRMPDPQPSPSRLLIAARKNDETFSVEAPAVYSILDSTPAEGHGHALIGLVELTRIVEGEFMGKQMDKEVRAFFADIDLPDRVEVSEPDYLPGYGPENAPNMAQLNRFNALPAPHGDVQVSDLRWLDISPVDHDADGTPRFADRASGDQIRTECHLRVEAHYPIAVASQSVNADAVRRHVASLFDGETLDGGLVDETSTVVHADDAERLVAARLMNLSFPCRITADPDEPTLDLDAILPAQPPWPIEDLPH